MSLRSPSSSSIAPRSKCLCRATGKSRNLFLSRTTVLPYLRTISPHNRTPSFSRKARSSPAIRAVRSKASTTPGLYCSSNGTSWRRILFLSGDSDRFEASILGTRCWQRQYSAVSSRLTSSRGLIIVRLLSEDRHRLTGCSPRSPRVPVPLTRCINTVSMWSSVVCPTATLSAPMDDATSARKP